MHRRLILNRLILSLLCMPFDDRQRSIQSLRGVVHPVPMWVEQADGRAVPTMCCDRCGQPIYASEEGWVEWMVRGTNHISGTARVVHAMGWGPGQRGCQYSYGDELRLRGLRADLPLDDYRSVTGLENLLDFIETGELSLTAGLVLVGRLFMLGNAGETASGQLLVR